MHFGIKLMSINLARAHLADCDLPNKLMLRMNMVYVENIVTTLAVLYLSLDFRQLGTNAFQQTNQWVTFLGFPIS